MCSTTALKGHLWPTAFSASRAGLWPSVTETLITCSKTHLVVLQSICCLTLWVLVNKHIRIALKIKPWISLKQTFYLWFLTSAWEAQAGLKWPQAILWEMYLSCFGTWKRWTTYSFLQVELNHDQTFDTAGKTASSTSFRIY